MNSPAEILRLNTDNILLRRIRFVDSRPDNADVVMQFTGQQPRYAISETVDFDDLPPVATGPEPTDELYLLLLLSGSATPFDLRRRAEQWMLKPALAGARSTVELVTHGDRVLWRPGRTVVIGASERFEELMAALVDFSFHEGALRRLENAIDTDYQAAAQDVALTHQVDETAIARWPHVNTMTHAVTGYRMAFVPLEARLEKSSNQLTGPARILVSELVMQTDATDRLSLLDDKLEVLEDLYELANDRISEFSYFKREYRLEWAILFVLVVEVIVMLWEIYFIAQPGLK